MRKSGYYFPHYSNARNDAKLIKLRRVLGIEGYGLYFMLLEILREQTDYTLPLETIEDLSFEWHTSKEKLMSVVTHFDLFTITEDKFFSANLIKNITPYIERSERAKLAAQKRWSDQKALQAGEKTDANAMQMHSKCNADQNANKIIKEKIRKDNKRKEEEKNNKKRKPSASLMRNASISIDEVIKDFKKREDLKNADAEHYFNVTLDWSDAKAVKRADWMATIRNIARRDISDGKLKTSGNKKLKPWER